MNTDLYIYLIITRSILLRMTEVSKKNVAEQIKTYFMLNNFFS